MPLESVYPSNFYNLPHPQTPYCNIQFRKTAGSDLEDPNIWEEITLNPNNFFNSISIEDNGGIQTVNLTLFDKNFSRLEKAVIKALTITRLGNILVQNPSAPVDDKSYFEFKIDQTSMVNLRVRIGYSEDPIGEVIRDTSFSGEKFVKRVNENNVAIPVIRSPWIYLQILDANFSPTPEGLTVTMKAISITGTFLDKAKLMQKYAKLTGTPENIIKDIGDIVNSASNGFLIFEQPTGEEKPRAYTNKDGKKEIEIMLGGKPVFKKNEFGQREIIIDYQPLRRLLDELCSKIAPIIYDHDDKEIPLSDDSNSEGKGIDKNSEKIKRIVKYGYVVDKDPITKVNIIRFYYKDATAQLNKQSYVRVYPWIEHGHTIIKNLSIDTKTDFAQLNLPVALLNEDGTYLYSAQGENPGSIDTDDIEKKMDFTLSTIKNITNAIDNDNFKGMFIAETKDMAELSAGVSSGKTTDKMVAGQYVRELIHNLNNQVFNGSIDIPGDPFYFFDSNLRPYSYLIKIIVNRPTYYDLLSETISNQGEADRRYGITGGEKSYLSGYYVIKKITHRLDSSGYNTNLEIMKFPSPKLLI